MSLDSQLPVMGNGERVAEEAADDVVESNGAREPHMPSHSIEPVLSEIGIAESTPDAESTQDPTPSVSGSSPHLGLEESPGLRPLSISKTRGVSDALGPAVSDVQEFDFWSKPGKLLEQSADGQPVSSPKLWSHGGRARVSAALQEGAGAVSPSSPLGDAFNVRDSFVLAEGFVPFGCAEVREFGEGEAGISGAGPLGVNSIVHFDNVEGAKEESVRKAGVVQSAEVEEGRHVIREPEQELQSTSAVGKDSIAGARFEQSEAGTSKRGADKAESTSCAFVTKPAASSSSTFDSAFSVGGPLRQPSDGVNGPSSDGRPRKAGAKSSDAQAEGLKRAALEPPVVPKDRVLLRATPEVHPSDSASVSSSTPSQAEARKHGDSKSTASSTSDTSAKGVRGRGSEIASTSGRTGADSPRAGPEHLTLTPPVSRPLYTDTPAMANDVVFGVSTVGKLGRANSFATGSIKGATVFTSDGLGQRKTHSEPKRVSFQLGAAEGKKAGGGLVPGSPRSPRATKLKEGGQSAEDNSRGLERGGSGSKGFESHRKQQEGQKEDHRGGAESRDKGSSPGASKAEGGVDVQSRKEKAEAEVRRSLATVPEGGSPKVIDRSALFKKWLEKNKELAQSEGGKGRRKCPRFPGVKVNLSLLASIVFGWYAARLTGSRN